MDDLTIPLDPWDPGKYLSIFFLTRMLYRHLIAITGWQDITEHCSDFLAKKKRIQTDAFIISFRVICGY